MHIPLSFPVVSVMAVTEIYPLLTELSLVQINALWNSIYSKKSDEILVWRYNIPITGKSFNTIHMEASSDQSSGWLNDEVKTTFHSIRRSVFLLFSHFLVCLFVHLCNLLLLLVPFCSRFLARKLIRLFLPLILFWKIYFPFVRLLTTLWLSSRRPAKLR